MSYLVRPSDVFDQLLGGNSKLNTTSPAETRRGVHAAYPATTPKYSTSNGEASLNTMARLLIPLENSKAYSSFLASFSSAEARTLAKSLATYSTKRQAMGYLDFLLMSAQEGWQEKVQIVDVLSDNYVAYFFGSQPPVFNYTGALMNSKQDDWRAAFTILYNDIIRGTQLARRQRSVTLAYDRMAVTGALLAFNQTLTAEMQLASQFQFQLLVKRIDVYRTILSRPTAVSNTPAGVIISNLATEEMSTVAPKTIRVIQAPQYTPDSREKPSNDDGFLVEGELPPPEQSFANGPAATGIGPGSGAGPLPSHVE